MRAEDLIVEVRDPNLKRIGLVPPEDLNLTATILYNNVGNWTLSLPIEHRMSSLLRAPGVGLLCTLGGEPLFSGPMTSVAFGADAEDPWGTLVFSGVTDDILLADRQAWPQPSNADPTTQNVSVDKRTGAAEAVMHGFVAANVGPNAPSGRRDARLVMGTNNGLGMSVTKSARFTQLGSLLSEIATAAGLGYRVIQRGQTLSFETSAQRDRSALIRLATLGQASDNLQSESLTLSAPTATRAIVGGTGEDQTRAFYFAQATPAETLWNRVIERFIDQSQTDDTNEYATAASELFAQEGQALAIDAKAVPLPDFSRRFNSEWRLGDLVSVRIDYGDYVVPISGAVLKVDPDGVAFGITLGDPSNVSPEAEQAAAFADALRRVAALERH